MNAPSTTSPKYLYIMQELRGRIKALRDSGENCLPTERELCQQYQVSRVTVRRALDELEKSGELFRVQGKGAFLSREKIQQPLAYLSSFSEDMQARNMTSGSRVLALETVSASAPVAEKLHVKEGAPIVLLKRLRLADERPIAIETCYLIREVGSIVMEHIADNVSLYALMDRRCGVKPVSANQSIEVGLLLPWERSLLGGDTTTYALCMTRQTADQTGRVVEYTQSKYRGDGYSYHISFSIKAE